MLTAGKEVLTRNPVSETAAKENRSQSRIQQAVLRLCSHRLPQAVYIKALRQDRVTKEASVNVYCVFSHSTEKNKGNAPNIHKTMEGRFCEDNAARRLADAIAKG